MSGMSKRSKGTVQLSKGHFFVKGSLRNRLAFYFTMLAFVPLLIIGIVTVAVLNSTHSYDISQMEQQVIDHKIAELGKFFSDTLGILQLRVGFEEFAEIDLSQQYFL